MGARVIFRIGIGVAAVMVLLAGAGALFLATLDIETYRPRIQAAAQAATGRAVSFGTMRLCLGLAPSITVREARLANLPGGTRADMLEVGEVELDVALLPLISGNIAIRRLVLKSPSILLETVNGEPNWRFSPGSVPAGAAPGAPRRATSLDIGTVQVRDARLEFPGAPPGGVTLAMLDASGSGNLMLRGALRWGNVPIDFDAEGGPLARLLGAAGPAWPVRLRAELGGVRLQAQGEIQEPHGLLGYSLEISGEASSLEGLASLLGRPLPPLRTVAWRGRVTGTGFGLPTPQAVTLTVGTATLAPGLELARLELTMPAAAEPAQLSIAGSRDGQAFAAAGTVGPLGPVLAGEPLGVDLSGEHLAYALGIQGRVARPLAGTGVQVVVTGRHASFGNARARLTERGAYFAEGAALTEIALDGPLGAGSGELVLTRAPVPGVTGSLALSRLDLDAVRRRSAPAPAPPAPAPDGRLIPDIALDLRGLPAAAADLAFSVDTLRLGGRDWRAVEGQFLLADARARFDPLALALPGGRLTLRLAADNSGPVPQLQISARSDGLDVATFGAPLNGRGEIDLDLRGQGADTRAWAAGAIGHVGFAITNGRVASSVLRGALPAQAQGLASEVGIACLAVRFDVVAGIGQARALFVDSSLGRVTGQGMVSLRDETLALRLNTDLRLPLPGTPGLRVRAPLPVNGSWSAPRFDGSAIVGGALSGQADRLLPGLGQALGQALGGGATAAMSDCGTALGLARGGRPGPVPASQAPAAETAPPAARPQVQDLLRGLLR